MRTEAYKLFGVDLTQIPGLMTLVFMLFSEVGRDMLDGLRRRILSHGWDCAPTTTSAEGRFLWRGLAKRRIAPGRYSDWRPTPYTGTKLPMGTIFAA